MKTDIYYFSGTGNSLNIAQNLNKKMEHSKIISIPQIINNVDYITGDIIGIVCPIYFLNMPLMVRDFIKKIKDPKYVFMVYCGTGDLGTGLKATKKLFAAQNIKLSALFNIPMPENSTVHTESDEKEQEKLSNVNKKTENIVTIINKKEEYFDCRNVSHRNVSQFETYIFPGLLFKVLYSGINKIDKKFTVGESCIGCGTCMKVCPVNNITMKDKKPVWNNQCQACLACYNWCPQEAIKSPYVNAELPRYHNPTITVKDIISSSVEK